MPMRRIDDLGRVVIPKGLRAQIGINEGDALNIEYKDGLIIMTKAVIKCNYCSSEIFNYHDRIYPTLCDQCLEKLEIK